MRFRKPLIIALFLSLLVGLSACESTEDKVEKFYQKGMVLLEAGDIPRAQLEFRNVLDLDGAHRLARMAYAQTVVDQGKIREAYGQYLRLIEYYPDDAEARLILAEMALERFNWDEVARHIEVAAKATPEDPRVQAVQIALAYRNGLEDKDREAQQAAVKKATVLKEILPDSIVLRRVVIDGFLRTGDRRAALAELDATLVKHKTDLSLYRIRLALLNEMGRPEALEQQLVQMVGIFPDEVDVRRTLIRWYMSRKELGKAEDFLRAQAADGGDGAGADLINFIVSTQGIDAGQTELDRIIASGTNPEFYRALRASLDFDAGRQTEAVAELEDIIATAEPSDQLRKIKLTLARMRSATGNQVGGRALVEEVLAEDATEVEALKLKAGWLIDGDQADEAIITLRAALDQSPNDARIMTLMARAHERNGSRALVGDMLSLAVDASNNAPEESILYARYLIADGKNLPAEGVLINALRLAPNELNLLAALGDVYLRISDWPRAKQILDTISRIEGPEAETMAINLKLALLNGQNRSDEMMTFLEDLAGQDQSAIPAQVAIIRTHIANGDIDKARSTLDAALEKSPQNRVLRALKGRFLENNGTPDQAIAIYRTLLAENNQDEPVWRELYGSLTRANRLPEAEKVLDEAIAILPGSGTLKWMKASLLEKRGDIDAAIAVYEDLYERSSSSPIVANNLASLITTYKTDKASLDRAYVIARRLRGIDQPAFQDTYGWIAYRRGDYEEARTYLEPAAANIGNDPAPAYHLGMTYIALDRPDDAIAQFRKAIELAGEDTSRDEVVAAKVELERLLSAPKPPAPDN
jgi:tetratricopeptide (TPR) repeat protein